mgnify:CR=1 FL=1
MADIKTKDTRKGTIKTIDNASVATQRMKQTYIASKEKEERTRIVLASVQWFFSILYI